MKAGVYCVKNTVEDKCYIGSSKNNLHDRSQYHIKALIKNKHSNKELQEDFNRLGQSSFETTILEVGDAKNISKREQHWKDTLNSCYNKVNPVSKSIHCIDGLNLANVKKLIEVLFDESVIKVEINEDKRAFDIILKDDVDEKILQIIIKGYKYFNVKLATLRKQKQ